MKRSCYVLEVSAPPGSAHYAMAYAYESLGRLRLQMEGQDVFGTGPQGAAALIAGFVFHPGTFALYVVQHGRITKHLDLRTVTRLEFDGRTAKLDDSAAVNALEPHFNSFSFHADDAHPRPRFVVDWPAIEGWAAPLEPPVLRRGQETDLEVDDPNLPVGLWLPDTEVISHGAYDLDQGEPAPDDDEPDGD